MLLSLPPSTRCPVLRPDAFAASALALVIEQVVACVLMALRTVRLTDVRPWKGARGSLRVVADRASVEMRRVHAQRRHAQVIDRLAGPQRACMEFERDAMGQELLPSFLDLDVEVAVPVGSDGPAPQPTGSASSVDLREEALAGVFGARPLVRHTAKYTEHIGFYLMAEVNARLERAA